MRDVSLERAIDIVGGTVALARAISLTPQAISQWDRVPAERVIAVENATKGKVSRYELRPDLYPDPSINLTNNAKEYNWVFNFGDGFADGNAGMSNLLGGKGANLAEMSSIGVPVPPGFTISTEACSFFYDDNKRFKEIISTQVNNGIRKMEGIVTSIFGDKTNPMLVSVRSGSRASMPGMMDTILNLGLNDQTVIGLSTKSNDKRFAYDSYRRFIHMYSDIVLGIDGYKFEEILDVFKSDKSLDQDTDLLSHDLEALVEAYKQIVLDETGAEFPQDVNEQLWGAISSVFMSWTNSRAKTYRSLHNIPEDWGTAVNVQAMVFGNMGNDCATGVCFTRNPSNGDKEFYGEYLLNAQGEDVVAGIRTPQQITLAGKNEQDSDLLSMEESMPDIFGELFNIGRNIESHFKNVQDIEFTIQKGKLWILQTRNAKRTVNAAIKIAVDMANEGLIDRKQAIMRIDVKQLDQLLHPVLDPDSQSQLLARGLPASPGAASGRVVFNSKEAEDWVRRGEKIILVRRETSPDDIAGMHVAEGILTTRGGMTSHAAVVARGMGTPCICGAGDIQVNEESRFLSVNESVIHEGDILTLDGASGKVYLGRVKTIQPELTGDFGHLMEWVDEIRTLRVRTNAETPSDAKTAIKFGAEGIGLCRTEHMFFDQERIINVRQMILASDKGGRVLALNKLLPHQRSDFIELFEVMSGLPVTIRLLDPPLHEFLPHSESEIKEVADSSGVSIQTVKNALNRLTEVNPMLGHRGCRLGITYPEIYTMQARAIFQAGIEVLRKGKEVFPEIMIPLVSNEKEFRLLKDLIDETAAKVFKEFDESIEYIVGTMIELPRAALVADEISKTAEFFSFGTNDLTQTTFGMSRDDCAPILEVYSDKGIYNRDPFSTLDLNGVGELIRIASIKGKKSRPNIKLGICGEHGGDPDSILFCQEIGLDYVSCSPFRVPLARLASAQAKIKIIEG